MVLISGILVLAKRSPHRWGGAAFGEAPGSAFRESGPAPTDAQRLILPCFVLVKTTTRLISSLSFGCRINVGPTPPALDVETREQYIVSSTTGNALNPISLSALTYRQSSVQKTDQCAYPSKWRSAETNPGSIAWNLASKNFSMSS